MKVEVGKQVVNIMSVYAPQQGCTDEEKEKFWEELDEEVRKVPFEEKLWIGGNFNGHVGSNNTGREETVGRYGYGDINDDCREGITNQHRPVICTLRVAELKAQTKSGMPKTKWWKLKEAECQSDFKEKAREKRGDRQRGVTGKLSQKI
ncbi:uncharacterized protein LOC134768402 [Penaeus indicus]|uniref:uncharacterized protein LOC134768402 n=1 Tax=Penaeus indicus TaxID=29960 RepID=UPI00300C46B5